MPPVVTAALRWLLLLALPVAAITSAVDVNGSVGLLGAVVVLAAVAAIALRCAGFDVDVVVVGSTGPTSDERCLRGSFRRQSSPDAPGRPLPRAPGFGLRLSS